MARHARKKWRQRVDARWQPPISLPPLNPGSPFPILPQAADAPECLRQALREELPALLSGHWRAFGHLPLEVDQSPRWHKDYLAGRDLANSATASAFHLNHRALPGGADIKLVWELSRWSPLVRLAMAAHVLDHAEAAARCVALLEDWHTHNPPYRGWNWTSALEVGMRLIQFTWIDALLSRRPSDPTLQARLQALRVQLLPAHIRMAWRHRSFGSSANNHLLGELTGLILAVARWPQLARYAAPLPHLQSLWERELLLQFAPDGGNREQALNYQLFSFEFGWQARLALQAVGRSVSDAVTQRLIAAARFFYEVQHPRDAWEYGDSDSAFVTPWFLDERHATEEWHHWLGNRTQPSGLGYWLGSSPPLGEPRLGVGEPLGTHAAADWWVYPDTGIAFLESGFWSLRWDLSPLGYLATAAHGHLDALHLSLWYRGVALVIDPGTGAYYADKSLRAWLASREAHNGPILPAGVLPSRLGPFLWSNHHPVPSWSERHGQVRAVWTLGNVEATRTIGRCSPDGRTVEDYVLKDSKPCPFEVRWQFAPGATVKLTSERNYRIRRGGVEMNLRLEGDWSEALLIETPEDRARMEQAHPLAGTTSRAFRHTEFAPYLLLRAVPGADKPCVFRTTFLASDAA